VVAVADVTEMGVMIVGAAAMTVVAAVTIVGAAVMIVEVVAGIRMYVCVCRLSLSLYLSLARSLSLTHTHALSLILCLCVCVILGRACLLSLFRFVPQFLRLSLSFSPPLSLSPSLSLALSLSLVVSLPPAFAIAVAVGLSLAHPPSCVVQRRSLPPILDLLLQVTGGGTDLLGMAHQCELKGWV